MSTDATAEALRRYRERLAHFFEYAAANGTTICGDLPRGLANEAALIVEDGPEAYLRYLRPIDDRNVRAELDRHLDEFAAGLGGDLR